MTAGDAVASVQGGDATVSIDNPWPGLLAFRETDQGYFQGRRRETDDLFRLVMRERLVVFFGLSGLGKSSLLQAGLFPLLRREQLFPVYLRLDFSPERPDLVGAGDAGDRARGGTFTTSRLRSQPRARRSGSTSTVTATTSGPRATGR